MPEDLILYRSISTNPKHPSSRSLADKLLPPFNTIDGMGDKAAEAMEIAAKDGPYLSKDDFRQRTKVSKTLVDLMADMGLLGDLPETNQLSLFDFA